MTEAAARSTTVDRAEQPPRSQWYDVWDQFKSHKGALVGAAVFGAILLFIFIGPLLWKTDPAYANLLMRNKAPKWNEALGAYCLNFSGRVSQASVKNFQLAWERDEEEVTLQFGKVGQRLFTCDFSWPITPVQALAICLSSFDHKLACE